MKVLLDTHALLWWLLDDPRLSRAARDVLRDVSTPVLVSSASAFEIATKHRLGKLGIVGFDPSVLPRAIRASAMEMLPITLEHALAGGNLEGPHRDPFDRLLIAQSRLEGVPIVTVDPVFAQYDVDVVW